MRIIVLIIFLLVLNSSKPILAQTSQANEIFACSQAIIQDHGTFYQVEGYSITDMYLDMPLTDKNINKIKKKFSFSKEIVPFTDTSLIRSNKVLFSEDTIYTFPTSQIYYLLPVDNVTTRVIGFNSYVARDTELERLFLKSILNNSVPLKIYTTMQVDSIDFAGRKIGLGSICGWKGVCNIQCGQLGQINWSVCRNMDKAVKVTQYQFIGNSEMGLYDIKSKEKINILFENTETTALKVIYKIKLPKRVLGGSNELVVYYVSAPVRGKFVSCLLSYYTNQGNDQNLPPLLGEVMKVK